MKNIITASIVFYFKGKKFSPSFTLELNSYMQTRGSVPDLYPLIANNNGIDLYSYEYEMMQAEPITIEHAEGLVTEYVTDGRLDTENFKLAWRKQQTLSTIQTVIAQHGLNELVQQYPELEKALLDTYLLGQQSPASDD